MPTPILIQNKFLFQKKLQTIKNVILLGDSLGDIGMIDGISHDVVLSIGFLNEDYDKQKEIYARHFDAVLPYYAGLDFVKELVSSLRN